MVCRCWASARLLSIWLSYAWGKDYHEAACHDASLPCILHWNQNHFVVCYKVKKYRSGRYRFYIADPASQKLCYTEEEFLHCWLSTKVHGQDCGMALLMTPGVNFGKRKEECESHKRNIKFFFKYLKPYQRQVGLLLLGMLLGACCNYFSLF